MPSIHKRLYIFTGKGGVGKTTLAMAFTKYLETSGLNVKYNCFHQTSEKALELAIRLPTINITVEESAEIYVGRKLNSPLISSWIMKTHFFKSLFQMIPSLILFGHLINELENDPSLIIVLDSPASGHALTMFEATSNFRTIFKSGVLVKDIDRMQSFLAFPNNLKTLIVTLATELSLSEALDLKNELDHNLLGTNANTELIINSSFLKFFEEEHLALNLLPLFFTQKVELEKNILNNGFAFPYVNNNDMTDVILDLSNKLEVLV
jgi:DNA polymerase III delta prime subunit